MQVMKTTITIATMKAITATIMETSAPRFLCNNYYNDGMLTWHNYTSLLFSVKNSHNNAIACAAQNPQHVHVTINIIICMQMYSFMYLMEVTYLKAAW